MSRAEESVIEAVTHEMDRRELKALRVSVAFLISIIVSIAIAAVSLGMMINGMTTRLDQATARVAAHEIALRTAQDEALRATANRFTAADYDTAASLFNMRTPPAMLPYFNEVQRASKRP